MKQKEENYADSVKVLTKQCVELIKENLVSDLTSLPGTVLKS